jgi:tape measure domain-containing protein
MARDTEQLILQLSADMRQFEKAMVKASGEADRAAQRVERRFQQMNQRVARDFSSFQAQVATIIATIGVGAIARDVIELGDAWTRVGNQLAVAGLEADALAGSQQTVADIALETRSNLEATAKLFARLYRSSEDLGASLSDVVLASTLVNKALSGASTAERASATVQLGQGLASGRLQGDELRSILENSRPLAEAIADEFGVAVGQLRKLGAEGQLESRRVFEAILAAQPEIEAAFARTNATVADSFENLKTSASRYVGTTEETVAANRGLANVIAFVATNFKELADAAIVTAAVIGGTLAGAAVGQAIRALTTMVSTMGAATIASRGLAGALAFFGGPLGLAITGVGLSLAFVATQTDLLRSSTQLATEAADSNYSALNAIITLSERLTVVKDNIDSTAHAQAHFADETGKAASQTGLLAEVSDDASAALDRLIIGSEQAGEQLSRQEQITRELAAAEIARTRATIEGARADQLAIVSSIERSRANRQLVTDLITFAGSRGRASAPSSGFTAEEQRAYLDARRNADTYRNSLEALAQAEEAVRSGRARLREEGGDGITPPDRPATTNTGAERSARDQLQDLDRAAELNLARLQSDLQRVAALEDAQETERRTLAYVEAGIALSEARRRAETQVQEERALTNQRAAEAIDLARLQESIDLARARQQNNLADAISDELQIRQRIARAVQDGMNADEAEAAARAYVEGMRAAANETRAAQVAERDLQQQLELARRRGDDRALEALSRRAALEERISELRQLGLDERAATTQAEAEIRALESAGIQGQFRRWFTTGVLAALDGDLGEFFQNWFQERLRAGLENALNEAADVLYDAFKGIIENVITGQGGGLGGIISNVLGGAASSGLGKLGKDAEDAGGKLKTQLAVAAVSAATQASLLGAASGAAAASEAAAAAQKGASSFSVVISFARLAKAAEAAAKALTAVGSAGGAGGGNTFASILSSIFSVGFGGFRAGGGPMTPGLAYTVGERGIETIVPRQPSFVIPNGGFGNGTSIAVNDNRTINITGASTAEVSQLRRELDQDFATRRGQIISVVNDAISRRSIR